MSEADAALRLLLVESLRLWRVPARLTERQGAIVITGLGSSVSIERAKPHLPFRWMVTVTTGDALPRQRPALSVISVLRQVRIALDPAFAAQRIRVAAPPVTLPGPITGGQPP